MEGLIERVAALERRLVELERRNTVRAPFRVTNKQGQTLLEVSAADHGCRLQLNDANGKLAIALFLDTAGGSIASYNGSGQPIARLGAIAEGGYIEVTNRERTTASAPEGAVTRAPEAP